VASHCTNTVVCQGQSFTQMLLTLIWRLGRTRPRRSSQRCMVFVVALTTNRVGASKPVMDIRRHRVSQLIPALVVDVVEALSDYFF
jgi:hypothetical protein